MAPIHGRSQLQKTIYLGLPGIYLVYLLYIHEFRGFLWVFHVGKCLQSSQWLIFGGFQCRDIFAIVTMDCLGMGIGI